MNQSFEIQQNRFGGKLRVLIGEKTEYVVTNRDDGQDRMWLQPIVTLASLATFVISLRLASPILLMVSVLFLLGSAVLWIFRIRSSGNRFFYTGDQRVPEWSVFNTTSWVPGATRNYLVRGNNIPACTISDFIPGGIDYVYWELRLADGTSLVHVVESDGAKAIRQAALITDSSNPGLQKLLTFNMISPANGGVIAQYSWQPSWQNKHSLVIQSDAIDARLLLSLVAVMDEPTN